MDLTIVPFRIGCGSKNPSMNLIFSNNFGRETTKFRMQSYLDNSLYYQTGPDYVTTLACMEYDTFRGSWNLNANFTRSHSRGPVLTVPNICVFFNINKPWNWLLSWFGNSGLFMPLCLRPQQSCHASLKFAAYSNLLNGDISKCQI